MNFNLFLGFLIGSIFLTTKMATSNLIAVLSSNTKFTNTFYNILAKQNEGNIFFSPISAHAVLAMAYQGAGGKTAEQFERTLNIENKKVAADGYNVVIPALNSIADVNIHIANKIFIMQGFSLKNEFKRVTEESFLSESKQLNFAESQKSADYINQWVESKTNSRIKDLIHPDWLDQLTRLVLVNAVYFKGNWAYKFKKEETSTKPFYISNDENVDCQMMHTKSLFSYREDRTLDAQVLELSYVNKDVRMVIILPKTKDGIADLEKKLVDADLARIAKSTYPTVVDISLPKFKIETDMDLKPILIEMGLDTIFDSHTANFSEINNDEKLFVSKVVQKAFIEVDEEGSEAAAATAAIMGIRGPAPRIVNFTADHPFIFFLMTKLENPVILFAGRISKP